MEGECNDSNGVERERTLGTGPVPYTCAHTLHYRVPFLSCLEHHLSEPVQCPEALSSYPYPLDSPRSLESRRCLSRRS